MSAGLWGRERGPKGPRKGQAAAATLPALPGLARRPNAQPGKGKQNPEEDGPGLLFGPSKAPFQRGDPFGTLDWDRIQMAPKPPSVRLSSSSIPPTRDHGWGGEGGGRQEPTQERQPGQAAHDSPPPPHAAPGAGFCQVCGQDEGLPQRARTGPFVQGSQTFPRRGKSCSVPLGSAGTSWLELEAADNKKRPHRLAWGKGSKDPPRAGQGDALAEQGRPRKKRLPSRHFWAPPAGRAVAHR